MKQILLIAFALAGLVRAQQPDSEKITSKIIPVHYVNVNHLANLVSIPGLSVKSDSQMSVLVVTGPEHGVDAIEEMVKKLDVPPPAEVVSTIELTGYLVSGSTQARGDEITADLSSTVKQLRALFPYKSYRVIDAFVLRGSATTSQRSSLANTSGILLGTNSEYRFSYTGATVLPGTPRSLRINNLDLEISTPTGARNEKGNPITRNVGIRTDVDIPEGQKVVVGKSNFTGADDALVLVLSAKILE